VISGLTTTFRPDQAARRKYDRAADTRAGRPRLSVYHSRRVGTEPWSWRIGVRLASGCARAYRVRMTTAAKLVWIVLAVLLVWALLGALALALISPG
jgi:hypothetical protein